MSTVTNLYDQDFHAWALKNAELLRQGHLSEKDPMGTGTSAQPNFLAVSSIAFNRLSPLG